jgi:hypothetical protein
MSLQHRAGARVSLSGHSPKPGRRSWTNVRAEHGCQGKIKRSAKLTLLECQFLTLPNVICGAGKPSESDLFGLDYSNQKAVLKILTQ